MQSKIDRMHEKYKELTPYLKLLVHQDRRKFYNTNILDERLIKIYPKWGDINKAHRLRLISDVLVSDEFGFKQWTSNTKKVVYDPSIEGVGQSDGD
jgi:hypothetical protein